jgi:hypothetical protein
VKADPFFRLMVLRSRVKLLVFGVALLLIVTFPLTSGFSGVATLTYYHSYAECCEGEANYDPEADTTECDLYSACSYTGSFAAWPQEKKSLEFVQNSSLIAFYEYDDKNFSSFYKDFAGRTITLTKDGTIIFEAIIADTCGDADCNGCCNANSRDTGYLVDLEYFTMMRNFDNPADASGTIEFFIDVEHNATIVQPYGDGDDDDIEYYLMAIGIPLGVLLLCAVVLYIFYDRLIAIFAYDDTIRGKSEQSWQSIVRTPPSVETEGDNDEEDMAEKHLRMAQAVSKKPSKEVNKKSRSKSPKKSPSSAVPPNPPKRVSKQSKKPTIPPPAPAPLMSNMFAQEDQNEEFSNENPNFKRFSMSDI